MDRQEAIKVIKDNWPEGQVLLKLALEFLIPELKENEDEKIRKELLSFVKAMLTCHDKPNAERDEKYESWIAWLEKQGEQKPIVIIPQFKVGDTIKPKSYNEEHLIKGINENGYVLDVDITIPFKDEDVWEIVAQNPAWGEEDENYYQNCLKGMRTYSGKDTPVSKWIESLKDRVQSQPKQEWSEVNIDYSSEVIGFLKNYIKAYGCTAMNSWVNWLETIKDRVQPQPKQEWSKEQKQCLDEAIYELENLGYDGIAENLKSLKPHPKQEWCEEDEKRVNSIISSIDYCSDQYPDRKEYAKDIDWLKSLKNRVQPQPKQEWSEEDEMFLFNIIKDFERLEKESKMEQLKDVYSKEINWLKSLKPHPKQEWSEESDKRYKKILDLLSGIGFIDDLTYEESQELQDYFKSLKPKKPLEAE